MNEAETKIVKQYIEMMGNNATSPLMATLPEAKGWHKTLMKAPEYEALNALVEEPKKPKKQTLADIAKQKYPSFRHGLLELTLQQTFDCLSDYLEQNEG